MKKYLLIFSMGIFCATQAQLPTTVQFLRNSSGYFRVTAKGFVCNRESADDMLERDGKRDEIYLTSSSVMFDASGVSIPSTAMNLRSRTMGDINAREAQERRAMAGSAVGNLGGIQTGDQVPDVQPWKNNAPAKGDLLPFVVWEGELSHGKSVLIVPSIMEWDGPADFLTAFWYEGLVGKLLHVPVALSNIPFSALTGSTIDGNYGMGSYDDATPGVFPPPTVIQQFPNFYKVNFDALNLVEKQNFRKANSVDAGRPNDRPIGMSDGMYNPLNIRMDANAFEKVADTDFGYGKGIIPIRYKDGNSLNGDYIVYYLFEKIVSDADKNKINVTTADAFNPTTAYKFRNAHANKVMDLLNAGSILVLNDDKNISTQKFYPKREGNYFRFQNTYNNQFLEVLLVNNKSVMGTSQTGANNWAMIRYCDGSWIVKNSANAGDYAVFSTENMGTGILTPVTFEKFAGAKNQRWFIEE